MRGGSRAQLLRLGLRSYRAARGDRRAAHPFTIGLRVGQVIPHQGGHWPNTMPNTMAAFERAAARSQVLDIDLWLTSDGVLVCSHDDDIDPGVRISETSWPELETATDVPRFLDVANAFPDHRLNVELKDPTGVPALRDALTDAALAARCCLSAFSILLSRAMAGAVPNAAHARPTARAVGRLWGYGDVVETMTFVPDTARTWYGPLILRWLFTAGDVERVAAQIPTARKKETPIFAWTVNDDAPLRRLRQAGIDAVLSDRPELFDDP